MSIHLEINQQHIKHQHEDPFISNFISLPAKHMHFVKNILFEMGSHHSLRGQIHPFLYEDCGELNLMKAYRAPRWIPPLLGAIN